MIIFNTIINFCLRLIPLIIILYCVWHKGKPLYSLYLGIKDAFTRDSSLFRGFGFWLYCGLGGSGKTISMVEYLVRMKTRYPDIKVYTNFDFDMSDGKIDSWRDIINLENFIAVPITENEYLKNYLNDSYNYYADEYGFFKKFHRGIIFGFDEIHLTFASQNWQDCPSNMLEYISQQRKLHKQIVASSQVFTRIDKKLREQTNYVIECKSFFNGRWIWNKAYDTSNYLANGEKQDKGQKKRKKAWKYNFVAVDKIRNHYNTMQVMKDLSVGKSDSQIKKDLIKDLIAYEMLNNSSGLPL